TPAHPILRGMLRHQPAQAAVVQRPATVLIGPPAEAEHEADQHGRAAHAPGHDHEGLAAVDHEAARGDTSSRYATAAFSASARGMRVSAASARRSRRYISTTRPRASAQDFAS